jgi:hypothetical protein
LCKAARPFHVADEAIFHLRGRRAEAYENQDEIGILYRDRAPVARVEFYMIF